MPSDRDLAQQFIAGRLRRLDVKDVCTEPDEAFCEDVCSSCLAAAILDTPGVVVAASWSLHGPGPGRLVIELPIEPSAPVEPVKEEK